MLDTLGLHAVHLTRELVNPMFDILHMGVTGLLLMVPLQSIHPYCSETFSLEVSKSFQGSL